MRKLPHAVLAGTLAAGLLASVPGDSAPVPSAAHRVTATERSVDAGYTAEIAGISAGILRLYNQAPSDESGRGFDRAMLAVTVPVLGHDTLKLATLPDISGAKNDSQMGPIIEITGSRQGHTIFDLVLAHAPGGAIYEPAYTPEQVTKPSWLAYCTSYYAGEGNPPTNETQQMFQHLVGGATVDLGMDQQPVLHQVGKKHYWAEYTTPDQFLQQMIAQTRIAISAADAAQSASLIEALTGSGAAQQGSLAAASQYPDICANQPSK